MIKQLGQKLKTGVGRFGNKLNNAWGQGAKLVRHPLFKVGVGVAGITAGALSVTEPARKEREKQREGARLMRTHRLEEHFKEMERRDPGGLGKKRLDDFAKTKPFEEAFKFDNPW